jgi:nucleoside-diphosphate-sugar epimerase
MRIAITGATGNVGTAVIEALRQRPEIEGIVGIARRVPRWQPAGVQWVGADIVADDLVAPFRGCDAVVHLAWGIQPNRDQDALWRTNVIGTERVLDAAVRAGVGRVVHASSIGAYSPAPDGMVIDENWPTNGIPQLGYSWQKAYVERLLDSFEARTDVAVTRLRPALIFRRDVAHEIRRLFIGRLVPTGLARTWMRAVIHAIPTNFQVVHSLDVGEAYALAAVGNESGAFNIAAEPSLGWSAPIGRLEPALHDAAALAWRLRALAAEPGWVDLALRAPLMDTTRAHEVLGWKPRHSADDALRELLDGFRSDARFPTPPLAD